MDESDGEGRWDMMFLTRPIIFIVTLILQGYTAEVRSYSDIFAE